MYGLSAFFIGEQRVTGELGPIMRAAPSEEMRIFLSTQTNEEQGTLPGFVEGFGNVARDEHRHVAFGARFLTDMAAADDRNRDAIQRTLVESLPVAEGVLRPPFAPEDDDDFELFGVSMRVTEAFAAQCLTRRLKVIGLAG